MKISSSTIKTEKTATFYTAGNKDSKNHLYLFHGYAQNAKDFLLEFDYLTEEYFLISIQGLSAFYSKGVFGDVAYSWMTKENREDEISDYIKLTRNIHSEFSKYSENDTFLGFSQGSQTASRWFNQINDQSLCRLILCGGLIPKDCDSIERADIIIGNNDKFIPLESISEFKSLHPQLTYHEFDGKHELNHEILKKILIDNQ